MYKYKKPLLFLIMILFGLMSAALVLSETQYRIVTWDKAMSVGSYYIVGVVGYTNPALPSPALSETYLSSTTRKIDSLKVISRLFNQSGCGQASYGGQSSSTCNPSATGGTRRCNTSFGVVTNTTLGSTVISKHRYKQEYLDWNNVLQISKGVFYTSSGGLYSDETSFLGGVNGCPAFLPNPPDED